MDHDDEYHDFSDSGSHSEHDEYEHEEDSGDDHDNENNETLNNSLLDGADSSKRNMDTNLEELRAKIEDLTMELNVEKNLHEATRKRLEQKTTSSNELETEKENTNAAIARAVSAEQHLDALQRQMENTQSNFQKDLDKTNKELTNEREKSLNLLSKSIVNSSSPPQSASDSGKLRQLPKELRKEFLKFCTQNKIDYDVPEVKEITSEDCIKILSKGSHKINSLKRKIEENDKPITPPVAQPRPPIPQGTETELQNRVMNLEEELRLAFNAAEDIRVLKAKVIQLVGHVRHEKECRLKAETEVKLSHKKMNILSNHIEKLMAHLKHEATAKIKYMDQLKVSEAEVQRVKQNVVLVSKKSSAKDRLIVELREGSKVLEDQLRLMDEKYLELRTKLDWSRDVSNKRLKKAQKTASELRMKFMMAGNSVLLDTLPLPGINQSSSAGSNTHNSSTVSWAPSVGSNDGSPVRNVGKSSLRSSSAESRHGRGHTQFAEGTKTESNGSPEPSLDHILEKIRRHKHESAGWTDEKIQGLIKR
mmetsp:Transcript_33170/g.33780  ORF Transcript_33170/g.33780 Transcript_33170/m.33780 type:complete len:534 (-) Transcript_33170:176-1777(-)